MALKVDERAYWREKVEEKEMLWPGWEPVQFWEDDDLETRE